MKIFKKARIAGAVLLATAGIAVGTAQADSYLAPLVISDTAAGTETYFAFKMRGKGIADAYTKNQGGNPLDSAIHYYFLQKLDFLGDPVTSVTGLYENASTGGCAVTNTSGHGSSWDMVFQKVSDWGGVNETNMIPSDESEPAGWLRGGAFDPGEFYGMMVIDDVANLPVEPSNGRRDNEGAMSGFAYVVNSVTGIMFDYKLLNNPFTKRSGDFKAGWISKTSIDWMWLPANNTRAPFLTQERTAWLTAVTGEGMTAKAEQSGFWNEAVTFTQANQTGTTSILPIFEKNGVDAPGAYNNDEEVLSGPKDFSVQCLGLYDRTSFLTTQQLSQSQNGGWKRVHIVPVSNSGRDDVKTHGAITYRMDDLNNYNSRPSLPPVPGIPGRVIGGLPDIGVTFNVETGGHLSNGKNKEHPNRGY